MMTNLANSVRTATGFSGYPWSGGELTARQPMLNAGSMPLPFTKNKLGGGAKPVLTAFSRTMRGGLAYVA